MKKITLKSILNTTLIAFLLCIAINSAYPQIVTPNHNFGFESNITGDMDSWQCVPDCYKAEFDSIEKVEGKNSMSFRKGNVNVVVQLCLYQKIALPKPAKKIAASVFVKNIEHQYAWFSIAGFDLNGKIIATDSVPIANNPEWTKYTANIDHKDIHIVSIEIRTKESNDMRKKKKLWVDHFSVTCNGVDLLALEAKQANKTEKRAATIRNLVKLNEDLLLPETELEKMGTMKMVGFGETAHGSLETDRFIFNNIKQLILNHGCRLVLFEKSIDFIALYNLYIHGYEIDSTWTRFLPGFEKAEITYTKLQFLSSEQKRFFDWLRQYNAQTNDKVNVMGVDLHDSPLSSNMTPPYLNRYISSMKLSSATVDSLVSLINSGDWRKVPLRYAIENEKELAGLMGKFNFMVLLQTLKSRTDSVLVSPKYASFSEWQIVDRDQILWQNTKLVMSNFANSNSPVAICAHYAHLNKNTMIHFNTISPLGQYIAREYGDGYYHVGILLGKGETEAVVSKYGKKQHIYANLQLPVEGSIEDIAMKTGHDYFFTTGNISSHRPLLIRRSTYQLSDYQFLPAYFKGSADALMFIKTSTSCFENEESTE